MLKKLPKQGTSIDNLVCLKCQKTLLECPPDRCTDPDCPQKPRKEKEEEENQ